MLIMNVSRDSRSLLFPVYSPLRVRKSNWRRYLGKNVLSRQKKKKDCRQRRVRGYSFLLSYPTAIYVVALFGYMGAAVLRTGGVGVG